MGCVCCSLSSFISIVLDACERATLCTVCAMLTCCLLCTLIMMLVMGIGVGFHYCFVQNSVEAMGRAAKAAGSLRSGQPKTGSVMRSVDRDNRRGNSPGFSNKYGDRARRALDEVPPLSNNNTINSMNSTSVAQNMTMEEMKSQNNSDISNLNFAKFYRFLVS